MVAGEAQPADLTPDAAERRADAAGRQAVAGERAGEQHLDGGQHLGEPEGGDRDDQPGGVGEPAQQQVDEQPEDDRRDEDQRDGEPVRQSAADQQQPGAGRDRAEAGLRDVEHAGGPVDQDDPEGDQADQRPEHDAVEQDADGGAGQGEEDDGAEGRGGGAGRGPHLGAVRGNVPTT